MKIIRWDLLDSPESTRTINRLCTQSKGLALTIGGFDGPHVGHQALFNAVIDVSREHNLTPALVTFIRSPGALTRSSGYPGDVSTLQLRLAAFERAGFSLAILIDFSPDFGKMSGGVFFEILVKTVRMRYLAVGPDFRCGHRLDTGVAQIEAISRKDGFRFDSIRQIEIDGLRVSSSAIRKAVQSADFALAERFLGHPFLLDFTTQGWSSSGNAYKAKREDFSQILPGSGRYAVNVSWKNGENVSAYLEIEGLFVSLSPQEGDHLPPADQIETVQFRLS